jgi:calcineurin-like phosphoesterase family protein
MDSSEIYFTADTHFGHGKMAEHRHFLSVEDMDDALIQRWNEVVPPKGIVYHLGDVSFANRARTEIILAQLNGRWRLVAGNHDKGHSRKNHYARFEWIKDYYEMEVTDTGRRLVLCHFPFRTWNRAHYGAWNLHGHSHGNLPSVGGQMDVGVDTHDLRPYTYAEVAAFLSVRPYIPVDHHA